jgi:DNA-binding NtrC family response regulator
MPRAAANAHTTSTVLVVEDDALTRFATAGYLADRGWRVLEAACGEDARTMLNADATIDLVFTDVEMPPGPDGIALAYWVHARHPAVEMMLTSGMDCMNGVPANVCAPASKFRKPYLCEAVADRIHTLIGLG